MKTDDIIILLERKEAEQSFNFKSKLANFLRCCGFALSMAFVMRAGIIGHPFLDRYPLESHEVKLYQENEAKLFKYKERREETSHQEYKEYLDKEIPVLENLLQVKENIPEVKRYVEWKKANNKEMNYWSYWAFSALSVLVGGSFALENFNKKEYQSRLKSLEEIKLA